MAYLEIDPNGYDPGIDSDIAKARETLHMLQAQQAGTSTPVNWVSMASAFGPMLMQQGQGHQGMIQPPQVNPMHYQKHGLQLGDPSWLQMLLEQRRRQF